MCLGSLVLCLMDFLYFQWGLKSRSCCEILYIRCTHLMRVLFGVFCIVNPLETSPPPPYTLQTIVLYFYFLLQVFFKDTLYFLLKCVLPPVLLLLLKSFYC